MDPVIFTLQLGSFEFPLRWYGVLVAIGIAVSGWLAEQELRRRGENPEHVWNALLWLLPAGVIGARTWYVINAIVGGNTFYLENPIQMINIPAGGLHIYGGFLFGAVALYFYSRKYQIDMWLFLDVIAPITMIGQAVARPANFINQELYGFPTTLPWGIPIDAAHRLGLYRDLTLFPLETTRFHPTFAYEMIWNFITAGTLLWAVRRVPDKFKPGSILFWWLILAGTGRVLMEFFRIDQPRIFGGLTTTSQLVSFVMAGVGLLLLMARNGTFSIPGLKFPDAYRIAPPLPANPVEDEKISMKRQPPRKPM